MDKCKNCLWYKETNKGSGYCNMWDMYTKEEDTCEDFGEGEQMNKNEGFTIRCNKCGSEDEYKEGCYSNQFYKDNCKIILGINWSYEEGVIKCSKCGNTIEI